MQHCSRGRTGSHRRSAIRAFRYCAILHANCEADDHRPPILAQDALVAAPRMDRDAVHTEVLARLT